MTTFRRYQGVVAALTLTVVFSQFQLWVKAGEKPRDRSIAGGSRVVPKLDQAAPADNLEQTKFGRDAIQYKSVANQNFFGLPVRPKLDDVPASPATYLVVVDTAAGQVGMPLTLAVGVVEELNRKAGAEDRIAVWTINTPKATHALTTGFKKARSADLTKAIEALKSEVPLGIIDLKTGLAKALDLFARDGTEGSQAIVFLGSGNSKYNPLSDRDRNQLCEKMVKSRVAFFSVPLGMRLDAQNLHGFATATGGRVVRALPSDKTPATLVGRLRVALAAPILYAETFKLAGAEEYFPKKLPPLRSDVPTLVIGKCAPAQSITYEIDGSVAGRNVHVKQTERALAHEADNFFLATMVEQWRKAGDQPALMQADRALAHTQQVNFIARDELLGQGQMALMLDQPAVAEKLFQQAVALDPVDQEAKGGLVLARKLVKGELTRADLKKRLDKRDGAAFLIERVGADKAQHMKFDRGEMKNLLVQAKVGEAKAMVADPKQPLAPAMDNDPLMRQAQQRQAVEKQHINQIVNDALRQARRLLPTDPDVANDLLKRVLGNVRDNRDLPEEFRRGVINRLESALRNVVSDGIRVKQDQEQRLIALAKARDDSSRLAETLRDQEMTRERLRHYRTLMNQARFDDAFQEGLALVQDQTAQGRQVSVAAVAAYDTSLGAGNLHEIRELGRIRRERFLGTMMQVERSHVPFPDEPPIEFPPVARWKQITSLRKDRYESSGLTDDDPQTLRKLKELKTKLESSVTMDGFDANTPLKEALGFISERYGLTILLDVESFKADQQVMEPENLPVKLPKMISVRLETVLRLLLAQANATFVIRRDYIEITTPQRQAAEKTIRAYPVADLVTPIPNSVNQQSVNQTMMNSSMMGMMGSMGMQMMGMGMMSMMGMRGMMMGMMRGGMMGMMGMGGMGMMGMGGMGMMGMGGMGMMGMGGGIMGMGGGMGMMLGGQGQARGGMAGNLGGQFGLQGGNTSQILVRLITQVVGKPDDWVSPAQGNLGMMGGMMGMFGMFGMGGMMGFGGMMMGVPPPDPNDGYANPNEGGSLGYYAPTRALIVKGTSRIHTRLGGGLLAPKPAAAPGGNALLDVRAKRPVQVAGAGAQRPDPKKKKKPEPVVKVDSKKAWQEVLTAQRVQPGVIIAAADYLVERGKLEDASELLKADLRTATVVRPWVYEALELSLKLSKASVEDIERAELSFVALEPMDARGYLRAAKAMAENKHWEQAVTFCKQAAQLDPNSPLPYAEALTYAREGQDVEAMEWSSTHLLRNDWPVHNERYHAKAKDELKQLRDLFFQKKNAVAELRKLDAAAQSQQRDLHIELSWEGQADFDLEIKEPIGTTCSFQQRQTPNGGTLLNNRFTRTSRAAIPLGNSSRSLKETYVAAEAFSGSYEVTIRRIWGKPLASRATLTVTSHKGTSQERILLYAPIVCDYAKESPTRKINLADGRRTSAAQVSMLDTLSSKEDEEKLDTGDQVLNKLRNLANPELGATTAVSRVGIGALPPVAVEMMPTARSATPLPSNYQGKAQSMLEDGCEMTFRPVVDGNRQVVGMTLNPIFQTLNRGSSMPTVRNSVIPGGR